MRKEQCVGSFSVSPSMEFQTLGVELLLVVPNLGGMTFFICLKLWWSSDYFQNVSTLTGRRKVQIWGQKCQLERSHESHTEKLSGRQGWSSSEVERHQSQGAASNSSNSDVVSGETWRNVNQTAAAATLFPVSRGLFNSVPLAFTGSPGPSVHGEQTAVGTRWRTVEREDGRLMKERSRSE